MQEIDGDEFYTMKKLALSIIVQVVDIMYT